MNFREKIIEASFELFATKGYEKVTVSDIIKVVGSSRGGFYYHFNSKEEILEAITVGYLDEIKESYDRVISDHEGSSIELFSKIFETFYHYKKDQMKDWTKLQKLFSFEGSHAIFLKITRDFNELTARIYAKIIEDGVKKGEFNVKYTEALAQLWAREMLQISRLTRKELYKQENTFSKTFIHQLKFTEEMINRELGIDDLSIKVKSTVLDYMNDIREKITLKMRGGHHNV